MAIRARWHFAFKPIPESGTLGNVLRNDIAQTDLALVNGNVRLGAKLQQVIDT